MIKKILLFSFIAMLVLSCGSGFQKSPVDKLIRQMDDKQTFTIILHDLDIRGFLAKDYLHKYKIITEENGVPQERVTDWENVTPEFFRHHQNNMGMEIAVKTEDGKLNKNPSPPGFSNYVGNEKYGQWVQRDGGSFWEFYGKYAMFSSIFNMAMGGPIGYGMYNNYANNYRGRRPFYGTRDRYGRYDYGTNSKYTRNTRSTRSSNFFERRQQRTGWQSSSSNRTGRSSSSSYRSRGGGFGK
ncbi:MAG: hypothetical protein GVY19_02720 [Bacteroidetes bacterium]|jgi:hypothetical protein|nr:hypothetical protein [Bacteroidota bacterium]